MKKIYIEPEMEVYVFSKQDQIKASALVNPVLPSNMNGAESPITDAEGFADGFFWY